MKTFLLIPTGAGVGLTSACLGLIHALDCLGIKSGFLKPFLQLETNGTGADRSSALIGRTFGLVPPQAISQHHVERMLGDNQLDELLEQVISLHRQASIDKNIVVVEGVVPTGEA
ncbi:AAA family ATPase, partial [Rhizobium hidalgonense]